jgi:hypothetical protein
LAERRSDRIIELPNAPKAGLKGNVRDWQFGFVEQPASEVNAAGSRNGDGRRAEVGCEQPPQLALADS